MQDTREARPLGRVGGRIQLCFLCLLCFLCFRAIDNTILQIL